MTSGKLKNTHVAQIIFLFDNTALPPLRNLQFESVVPGPVLWLGAAGMDLRLGLA